MNTMYGTDSHGKHCEVHGENIWVKSGISQNSTDKPIAIKSMAACNTYKLIHYSTLETRNRKNFSYNK